MKESFVTSQDYHGIGSPAWFLPQLESVSKMEKLGFHLAFESTFEGTYRGLTIPPPWTNFLRLIGSLIYPTSCSVQYNKNQ